MLDVRLIDANALKKAFCEWCDSSDSANSDIVCGKSCATLDLFDSMPTIEAEPVRHGRWIKLPESWQADYECSECGTGIGKIKPPYCALCGARMDMSCMEGGDDEG